MPGEDPRQSFPYQFLVFHSATDLGESHGPLVTGHYYWLELNHLGELRRGSRRPQQRGAPHKPRNN